MKHTADKLYYKTTFESPIGKITLGSDGANLAGLWTEGQKYFCESVPGELITKDELPVFAETKNWLNRYFNGKKPEISELPLAPSGSEFRQAVWKILMEIPYGTVMTYGEIAKKIAEQRGVKSVSSQAVGGAVGHKYPFIRICSYNFVVFDKMIGCNKFPSSN